MANRRDRYASFAELARAEVEGVDFHVHVVDRGPSPVAVIAPHAGHIERSTSDVARAIAGDDCHLYLFEGSKPRDNVEHLHLTSHRFDEPRCLALVARCDTVVAVHGWAVGGEQVLLGGLDHRLRQQLEAAFRAAAIAVHDGAHADHRRLRGVHPRNVCNRGRHGRGVQLELSDRLRDADQWSRVAGVVRGVLAQHWPGRRGHGP